MQGLVTSVQNYTKNGEEKAVVTVLSLENGRASTLFLTKTELEKVGITNKVLNKEELQELSDKYETIEYTQESRMATLS